MGKASLGGTKAEANGDGKMVSYCIVSYRVRHGSTRLIEVFWYHRLNHQLCGSKSNKSCGWDVWSTMTFVNQVMAFFTCFALVIFLLEMYPFYQFPQWQLSRCSRYFVLFVSGRPFVLCVIYWVVDFDMNPMFKWKIVLDVNLFPI